MALFYYEAGSGFSVPQVIFPLGSAILVLWAFCAHRMCSLRKVLGGWGNLGTYVMRQNDLIYSPSSIKTKYNPQPSLLLGYVGLVMVWLGHGYGYERLKSA